MLIGYSGMLFSRQKYYRKITKIIHWEEGVFNNWITQMCESKQFANAKD